MGLLDFTICKGKELLKYGSKNSSSCDCVKGQDPNNIYTDGSLDKQTGQGGYGVYSPGLNIHMAKPYPYEKHKNNILRLESKAILEAVSDVKKNHKTRDRVDIFTDSEHALTHLQVLQNGERPLPSDDNNGLGERILKEINDDNWSTKVHMHKVKAHSGVEGNEIADCYARAGAKRAKKIESPLLSKSKSHDHQVYSNSPTPTSFSSYDKKRARVTQKVPSPSPYNNKFPKKSSVSPSPYNIPKNSYVSPSPSSAGRGKGDPDRSTKPPPSRGLFGGWLR